MMTDWPMATATALPPAAEARMGSLLALALGRPTTRGTTSDTESTNHVLYSTGAAHRRRCCHSKSRRRHSFPTRGYSQARQFARRQVPPAGSNKQAVATAMGPSKRSTWCESKTTQCFAGS